MPPVHGKGASTLPLREATSSSWLSRYRWEPFLAPCKGGFAFARTAADCYASTVTLMDQPGVYEFALTKGKHSQRYKVYVGQSSSLRRRLHQEYRGQKGSHLKTFFEEALANGCQATPEDAKKREAEFLRQFDYAWNIRQAGCQGRHVKVVVKQCCWSRSVQLVSKPVNPPIQQVVASAL